MDEENKNTYKADYGNSYGKKGKSNNNQLLTNDDLRVSMWKTNGFVVDKNLTKLAQMMQ
jgi:hypothetical protein